MTEDRNQIIKNYYDLVKTAAKDVVTIEGQGNYNDVLGYREYPVDNRITTKINKAIIIKSANVTENKRIMKFLVETFNNSFQFDYCL
jgi:hypothetical protein